MNPKKSLGQHWLFDEASLQAMLNAGEITSEDVVLEVGPGLGTLTKLLCATAQRVIAVELDDTLAAELEENLQRLSSSGLTRRSSKKLDSPIQSENDTTGNLEVIHEDILKFDFTTLPKKYKVIANIPYYLTSNLIRTMLESKNPPSTMVLLVQKEVAERVAAVPGAMGILSVATQFYADVALKELVPAELFTPPPKVDSQIIQIKRRMTPLFPDVDTKKFFQIVRAGFSEKRKKLRSSLSGGLGISKEQADQLLIKAQISLNVRAQELTLDAWHKLYQAVNSL